MRNQLHKVRILGIVSAVLWAVFLACLVLPDVLGTNTTLLAVLTVLSSLLAVTSLALFIMILLWPMTQRNKNSALTAEPVNGTLTKTLATLLAASLIISTYSAVHSLGASPVHGDKFVWQNIATAAGLATIALMLVLSALQNDIYWYSRQRKLKLDEFQLRERYEVLETSYKIGSLLVIFAAYWLASNIHQIATYITDTTNPGTNIVTWAFFNVGLALFSLPLIVAAFKKKRRSL